MAINNCIGCEVRECMFNCEGKNCTLDKIEVSCGCGDNCTCCGSYQNR